MDKKNTGIIATIVAAILCGCPGICLGIFAAVTAAGIMPYTTTFNDVTNSGTVPASYGYVGLCVSVIFVLIPVIIGIVTLRKKPTDVVSVPPVTPLEPSEPLAPPPTIDISSPPQPPVEGETLPPKPSEPDEPLPPAI